MHCHAGHNRGLTRSLNMKEMIVIKSMIFALSLLVAGSSAAFANAYLHCTENSDCVRIYGVCGDRAVNKTYADEMQYKWSQEAALVTCTMPGDQKRDTSARRIPVCEENVCIMKYPQPEPK